MAESLIWIKVLKVIVIRTSAEILYCLKFIDNQVFSLDILKNMVLKQNISKCYFIISIPVVMTLWKFLLSLSSFIKIFKRLTVSTYNKSFIYYLWKESYILQYNLTCS